MEKAIFFYLQKHDFDERRQKTSKIVMNSIDLSPQHITPGNITASNYTKNYRITNLLIDDMRF